MRKLDRANNLLQQGKYQEAIALYEGLHKACPEEESVLLMLAWAHYDNGDTAKAEKYLEILFTRELQRKIFTGFAFDELVRLYKQENNFRKLMEICEKAVAAQPDDVGLLIELGNAYLQAGKAEDSCRIYEKLIHLEDDNPAYYCRLGEALFACDRPHESETAYLHACRIDPDQSDHYYFQIAHLFAKNGFPAEAQRLLKACITANPAKPLYHCHLGDILIGCGLVKEALAAYESAVRCDSSGAGAYYNRLGNSLMKENLFDLAADAFQKAIDCEAAVPFYLNLAAAYKALGKTKEAQDILRLVGTTKQSAH
jgi:tetratricopeptide (TPR) repeat protein